MKEYSFMLSFKDERGIAFINCIAEEWQEIVAEEKIVNLFLKPAIMDYLSHAICMRGHLFNPERHTPRKLYEALLNNPEWTVTVEGVNCELPDNLLAEDELPPDAID